MASQLPHPHTTPAPLPATETYTPPSHPTAPIRLRIATGGAGQVGLLRALADAFIAHRLRDTDAEPFAVAWCATDTTLSFNALALRQCDVAITYHPAAEQIAEMQGCVGRREYAWRDRWLLVGPTANPADLPTSTRDNPILIETLFTHLLLAMIRSHSHSLPTNTGSPPPSSPTVLSNPSPSPSPPSSSPSPRLPPDPPLPISFLSRSDSSANNILESRLWTSLGQTPWSWPPRPWYHRSVAFPVQALQEAASKGMYTITDRGTWCCRDDRIGGRMRVFAEGTDAPTDPLLNPAHALVGVDVENQAMAHAFVDWLTAETGGQEVVRTFASPGGEVLYSVAPAPASGTGEEVVRGRGMLGGSKL